MRDQRHSGRLWILAILLLATAVTAIWLRSNLNASRDTIVPGVKGLSMQELAAQLGALEAKEKEADQTVWAKERLAEQCGLVFDEFWDLVNLATNKMDVLRAIPAGQIIAAKYKTAAALGHGVEFLEPDTSHPPWTPEMWRQFVEARHREGWQVGQVEFRHNQFKTDSAGLASQSIFYFSAHLVNSAKTERAILEGDLVVDWDSSPSHPGLPGVKRIDASHLKIKTRRGEPAFRPILFEEVSPPKGSYFVDPLILYDLDGDGRSEIILAARNLVFRQKSGPGRFESAPLCRHSPGLVFTGVIADFDGDGAADYLCAKFEGLVLFKGSPGGTFDEPGREVWRIDPHLKYGQVLTCGDIDGDGDLDVWLGQYKVPYERGQMPTPFLDANDGHPSYLLINDGNGNFTDGTTAAGLEQKRWRRCYSSSFVDLDNDGDLDLMVVSDFAGLDLYANDGRGHFRDVTSEWVTDPRGFGMAHAVADFNSDGRLDFLMIGMNSPTADRLEHLGILREAPAQDRTARQAMSFGNRLYLAREGKPLFHQTSLNDSMARSGWSWGCSAFDFDNDGFPDLYIGNGHQSNRSVREYEPEFWLHDIYVANSKDNVVTAAYFGSQFARTRGRGYSFGGYEKNRLYLNQQGESFVEIGHLMGVALEPDSRNVVADDLDGDGRMDLLVTTFEERPVKKQTLQVFQNRLDDPGNWIGFRFRERGGGVSPVGAQITLRHAKGMMTREIITGDSYRSQHANTAHFGLGKITHLEIVEIRWTNGRRLVLPEPAINRYHDVK